MMYKGICGGRRRTRTFDPLIKSQLLYHLSYAPVWACRRPRRPIGIAPLPAPARSVYGSAFPSDALSRPPAKMGRPAPETSARRPLGASSRIKVPYIFPGKFRSIDKNVAPPVFGRKRIIGPQVRQNDCRVRGAGPRTWRGTMHMRHWLRPILVALAWAAFLAAPGLPLPAADRLGVGGSAAAQESIDIDTFYDELTPYGQWVWHPRFGYVWLPEIVSDNWRPYAVGRWTYTDEYGWYWDSYEPFAWAVYHYGRWGYDPDYGWFWVPGDTWAPAWVQWRYSDDYVGWAPIGPGRPGYAYGVPVNYDPPIAESWVFVPPRYMTSRAISHYALPIGGLSVAFFGATHVYRPQYRGGIVYNYGMPRDRLVQITRRPIYVQKVYKVDNWKGGRFDKDNRGVKVYQPHFSKDNRPNRGPKKFADNPNDFRPKAKLKDTFKGDVPKGWGPSAKGVKSISKEDPDAFKKKHDVDGRDFGDRGKNNDRDNDRNNDKGQASKDFDRDDRDKDNKKSFGSQGGPDQFKQGNRDQGDQGRSDKGKPKGSEPPPIEKVIREQGGADQFKQGNR